MNGSGGNEETIARLGLEVVQQLLARPLANGVGQLPAIDARPEPRVDRAAGIGGQDVPGLGLAQVGRIQPCGLFVVGMDLNRERLGGVEELHQERKTRLRMVAAEKFRPALANQFAQRRAGQRPLVDDALVRAVIADFPTLGIIVARAERLSQAGFQAAVPPQIAADEQAKTKRIKRDHRAVFPCGTGRLRRSELRSMPPAEYYKGLRSLENRPQRQSPPPALTICQAALTSILPCPNLPPRAICSRKAR